MKKATSKKLPNFFKNKFSEKLPFESLYRINLGRDLDENLAYESFRKILNIKDEGTRTALMSMLLSGVMIKGAHSDEIVGLIKAAFSLDDLSNKRKLIINLPNNEKIIGYAGSGKKGIKTINLSTPSAILAASCGVYVAKACSSSTSSITGSSDFLSSVGINFLHNTEKNLKLLKNNKIAFFSMENTTPNFAKVYAGRFFTPHALSFALAGLSLPVETDTILYGLAHPDIYLSAEVFQKFGFKNIMIISSTEDGVHYIDEAGISGSLSVVGIKNGLLGKTAQCLPSHELKLPNYSMNDLSQGKNEYDNVRLSVRALHGDGKSAHMDALCANAGMLIYLSGKAKQFREGYLIAKNNLMNGKGFEKLIEIINSSGGNENSLKKIL